ncbi:lytic transglycosylase domain-containing protein [Rouxiella silvae]|uniref:lytic transglycosylase domain-containing protein n=1 Tax=Rouxiella silvae TaxID=1646373 RepID=UPI0039EF05BC
MNTFKNSFLAACLITSIPSYAKTSVDVSQCYFTAGHDFHIDPLLLVAIGIKESRLNNNAINHKSNDYCQMQINQSHQKRLAEFGINPVNLTKEPCTCIYTGAWVLARNFKDYGRNWNSVGMYNTGPKNTPKLLKIRKSYSDDVRSIYTVLVTKRDIENKMLTSTQSENALANKR